MLPVFSNGWRRAHVLSEGRGNVGTGCKVRSDYDHQEGLLHDVQLKAFRGNCVTAALVR